MTVNAHIELQLGTLQLDVQVEVQRGETLAILGPNGAGKSTVLRCLAGLTPVDSGCIELGGVVVDKPAASIFVRPEHRSIGFVFQDYRLFTHMTVLENVAFGLRSRNVPKGSARSRAALSLDRLGLSEYANQRPHVLSGGQAQRVALARALVTDPTLVLLDEPLAALDAGIRHTVRRDLKQQLDAVDGPRIIVTHDPVDVFSLAGRVAILDGGRVVQAGTLAEVTARPRSRYVADLIGVNLVSGTVSNGVMTTPSGAHVVVDSAISGDCFAVLRPQSISILTSPSAESSNRNTWPVTISQTYRFGDRVRVAADGILPLTAEVTLSAVESLALQPGSQVYFSAKATDIETYPA